MQITSNEAIRDRLGPAIVFAVRVALGSGFGLASTMFSIAVAWGLYLFSGSHSLTVWLATLMFSAGVGAGAGSLLAWMQLDRGTDSKRMVTVISVVVIGVLSAWLGYHYGSNREIDCCASAEF